MNSQTVLVLSNHANRDLEHTISRIGFVPQVWSSMRHSLGKLRHQDFAAVIIDRKFTHADVLEFILNIRDINQEIPVVVMGSGKDEHMDQKIRRQNHTMILSGTNGKDLPAEKLERAIKRNENQNVSK